MASGWLTQWQIEHSLQLRGCHNLDKTVPGYRGNTAGYGITSQAYTAIQYSCKDVPNKQGSSRSNGPWGEIEPIVFPMRPTTKNVGRFGGSQVSGRFFSSLGAGKGVESNKNR